MRKIVFSTLVVSLICSVGRNVRGQEEAEKPVYGWQKEAVGNLSLTQTSFSNWVQGGENAYSWQLDLNGKFVLEQEKYNYSNSGKLSFGQTKVGDAASRKSADEIMLESVFAYKLSAKLGAYTAVTAETQFSRGFDYGVEPKLVVSDFMDPGYLRESAGLSYTPAEQVKSRLGFAMKQTFTRNHPAPYADDPATAIIEKTRSEAGAESVTDFSMKIDENVLLTSKLEFFSNLEAFNQIDVKWDNIIAAKVSKYISTNFNVKLFYDRDISTKRQIKQVLALGLTYAFL